MKLLIRTATLILPVASLAWLPHLAAGPQDNPGPGAGPASGAPGDRRASVHDPSPIVKQKGVYYLFINWFNWGRCCRGVNSTYNIRVGRSREVTGPYLDKEGVPLLEGGGSLVLESEGRFIGPGHAGILKEGERTFLSFHFYDGEERGRSKLAIRPLHWTADGWPRVEGDPLTPAKER